MSIGSIPLRYKVTIDPEQCMLCGRCVENCSYGVYRMEGDKIRINSRNCVACHRCTAFCPRDAISIYEKPTDYRSHPVWTREIRENIFNQAKTGKIILAGMGNALPYPMIFDRLVLDACQVTNPSIDPLREPMELRTYLGKKPASLVYPGDRKGEVELLTKLTPNLQIETPIMIGHMSYGAISLPAQQALAKAVSRIGTFMGTGEGGLHESLYPYQKNIIVQVASGRFGVDINYLERGAAIEIKIGQGAKPGIGGHLPGEKICADVSCTRMIPEGSDAISPAPHHDIYSIEDLKQLVRSLKEATEWKKPVFVKIAAVHNVAAIAAGIARSSADAVVIDGFRGGTGAAPVVFRDHVGIPIEAAIASVDAKLRSQGITERGLRHCQRGYPPERRCGKDHLPWRRCRLYRDLCPRCHGVPGVRNLQPGCMRMGYCNPETRTDKTAGSRDQCRPGREPDPWLDPGTRRTDGGCRYQQHREPAGQPRPAPGLHAGRRTAECARCENGGGMTMSTVTIDAKNLHYTPLNQQIRGQSLQGAKEIVIDNVLGQRFIGDGLRGDDVTITVNGVPGGDLAMFMSGPTIIVHGNADHAPGNTMDKGKVIIHGSAGDAVAHSMRGGRIYVRDNIGYRGGIHMKQYLEKRPILVVGGSARAFLGESMAGGIIIVLGLNGIPADCGAGCRKWYPWGGDLCPGPG